MVLDYTRVALRNTARDVKRASFAFTIGANLLYMAYLIYAIIVDAGILYLNIALAAITAAFFVFYIVTAIDESKKHARKAGVKTYRYIRLVADFFTLAASVYGIYIASSHATVLSLFLCATSLVGWTVRFILTLLSAYVEAHVNYIMTAVSADVEVMKRPLSTVENVINNVMGKGVETPAPTKTRARLDREVNDFREERAKKRADKWEARRNAIMEALNFKKNAEESEFEDKTKERDESLK